LVEGLSRAKILELFTDELFLESEVDVLDDDLKKTPEIEALMRSVLYQFEQYIKISRKVPPETLATVSDIDEPGRFTDVIASHLSMKLQQKQDILEAD
jgi:ATP-dependent Lon protease